MWLHVIYARKSLRFYFFEFFHGKLNYLEVPRSLFEKKIPSVPIKTLKPRRTRNNLDGSVKCEVNRVFYIAAYGYWIKMVSDLVPDRL